jgi:membrane protein DedA with SNARE-associated domain
MFKSVLDMATGAGNLQYLGLFALLILGGIGLPFPEDATLILCGFLIQQGTVRAAPALIIVYAGMLLADIFLYYMGRHFGRKVIALPIFRKMISPKRLAWLEEKFLKRGSWIILAGRHVGGLRAQIFIVSGIMRMPALKFILFDGISAIGTIALMVGLGYAGGDSLEAVQRDLSKIKHLGLLALVVVFVLFLFYLSFRAFRKR